MTMDGELDRQMKALRRGETETVVCPFCGIFSNSESGDCCMEMEDARDRLGASHLKSLEGQFSGARHGLRDSVQCPYCDGINRPENLASESEWKRPGVSPYCCDSMVSAVLALGERMLIQKKLDHKHKLEDSIAKVRQN